MFLRAAQVLGKTRTQHESSGPSLSEYFLCWIPGSNLSDLHHGLSLPERRTPRCRYPTSYPLLGSCVGRHRATAVSRFTQAKASLRLRKYLSPGSGRDASCNLFAGLYFGFIYICSCQSLMCGAKPYLPCEAAVASSSLSTNL